MTTLTTPEKPHVVRLSGPRGIVAAAAQSLGFEPSDSLVMACLKRPRGRIGPVLRVDLAALHDSNQVADLVDFVADHADSVAVLAFHDGPRPTGLDGLVDRLRERRVPMSWTLSIRQGLIRDARSAPVFERDVGIPVLTRGDDEFDQLHASSALVGRRMLASRDELAASIALSPSSDPVALSAAIEEVIAELTGTVPMDSEPLPAEAASMVDHLLRSALAEFHDGGAVTADTARQLIAVMDPTPGRDHVLARAVSHDDDGLVAVLSSVATRCPPRHAPQLCSVLAAAAYRFGNGALAHLALDRAQGQDPDHRLSLLVRAGVVGGMHPKTFAQLGRSIRCATPLNDPGRASPPPS